jgi:hypothetical protein
MQVKELFITVSPFANKLWEAEIESPEFHRFNTPKKAKEEDRKEYLNRELRLYDITTSKGDMLTVNLLLTTNEEDTIKVRFRGVDGLKGVTEILTTFSNRVLRAF